MGWIDVDFFREGIRQKMWSSNNVKTRGEEYVLENVAYTNHLKHVKMHQNFEGLNISTLLLVIETNGNWKIICEISPFSTQNNEKKILHIQKIDLVGPIQQWIYSFSPNIRHLFLLI